ncbi:hypothetical protein ACJIZ3_022398 [Penstemon smallii]|uniref:HMG box domain-containing protein n=1 Tax=Penstemon smallii TaxID=265156 RepID=A0ABD3TM22_9LAMI
MVGARKRVHAIRRGPDGSAFQKCESCGILLAIALADLHECGFKKTVKKKLKIGNFEKQRIEYQPRSAFRFFMEEFMKTCKDGNEVEIDMKACEIWKNMTKLEREPFVHRAQELNSAYVKLLREEEDEIQWVDDEADSYEVGNYDKYYKESEIYCEYGSSEESGFFLSESYDTFDTEVLLGVCPWATQRTH